MKSPHTWRDSGGLSGAFLILWYTVGASRGIVLSFRYLSLSYTKSKGSNLVCKTHLFYNQSIRTRSFPTNVCFKMSFVLRHFLFLLVPKAPYPHSTFNLPHLLIQITNMDARPSHTFTYLSQGPSQKDFFQQEFDISHQHLSQNSQTSTGPPSTTEHRVSGQSAITLTEHSEPPHQAAFSHQSVIELSLFFSFILQHFCSDVCMEPQWLAGL